MVLDRIEKKNIYKRIIENINFLREKFGEESSFVDRVIGVNYAFATTSLMNKMEGPSIFSDEYIDENEEEVGFSRKYLSKRLTIFYKLLRKFRNVNYKGEEKRLLLEIENGLEENIMVLGSNGRIKWLERNGYYSTFIMIQEGILTYGEWGENIEDMLYKRNQSTVNKLES